MEVRGSRSGFVEGEEEKEKLEIRKEREKVYIEVLKNIFNKLDESQLDWRLVGGVALNFYLDKIPDPYRPNGSVRDLDIVILNYQPEKVKEMEAFFEKKKAEFNRAHPKMPIYPKVNLHTIIKEKQYLEARLHVANFFII